MTDAPVNPSDIYCSDPVDTSVGAHKITTNVLKVSGARDLSFDLSYDSSKLSAGTMGKGWSNSYEMKLETQSDGSIFVYWSLSSYTRFTPNGNGQYTCDALGKQNDILAQNEDGSYLLDCNHDGKYSFDSGGRLTGLQDRTGMALTVSHSSEGNLVIREPVSGKYLSVSYNSDGLVQSVSDSADRTVAFGYNAIGCLDAITDANGKTVSYTYDQYGHVLTGTDGDGVRYFQDTYDANGRVASQDDAVEGNDLTDFSYKSDSTGENTIVTITDRNGSERTNTFNGQKQLISVKDENGNTKSYTYDNNGNLATETDANGGVTVHTYDDRNHLLSTTDQAGAETVYTYDANGNLLTQTNPDGGTITNTYDGSNRVISSTNQRGNVTAYTYDSDGLLTDKDVGPKQYTYTYEDATVYKGRNTDRNGLLTTNGGIHLPWDEYRRLFRGFPKGEPLWHTHIAEQSVVCYTLCQRCRGYPCCPVEVAEKQTERI